MRPSSRTQTDPGWLPEFQAGPRTRLRGRGSRTPSSRPGGPPLPAEATWPHRGDAASGGESPGDHGGPGLDGAARTFERPQTLSLLPGLEVVTGSAQPAESALEEGSLEEVAPLMPQSNGPGASQALDSTDLDIPTEAVTHVSNQSPGTRRAKAAGGLAGAEVTLNCFPAAPPPPTATALAKIPGPQEQESGFHVGPASGEPLGLHPTGGEWLWPPLGAGRHQADRERCPGWPQGPPEVADTPISSQPRQQEKQGQHQVCCLPDPSPGAGRLLRPLHPVLPVLRVPDAVQHRPGLRHVRLLQLRGLVPLLLLLRLRRVRRLRPALRPGLRHPGRLLRVGRLPGDLHGVLWALLLLLTRGVPGCHTRLDRPLPRASPTLPEPSRNPSPVRGRCWSSLLVSLDNST
nr:myoD family inhibitor isoform X2 [Globicephala melas]